MLVLVCASFWAGQVLAQEDGPRWPQLTSAEQGVLMPLKDQWHEIDAVRKLKWRELAQRYPNVPPDQQARIRDRMLEWAKLSAAERNAARLRYQAANSLPAAERKAKWDAYQSLSEDERRTLVGRAESRLQATAHQASAPALPKVSAVDQVQVKSNIVQKPLAPQGKPIGLGTVQAGVGASTRPITQRPQPPLHQQVGQPKIAATPEFVDRATLLPQRGPQAAVAEPQRASQ